MGSGYVQEIINGIQNPFWKDILKNWNQFCNSLEIMSDKVFWILLFGTIKNSKMAITFI